jgi:quinoprotein glucose dehydrogenase
MPAPRRSHIFLGVLTLLASLPFTGSSQNNPPNQAAGQMVQWRSYAGDERTDRYSPLDQINPTNVKNLQVAWTWRFDNYGTATETITTETTPLMVNGVLYFTAGPRRTVVAAKADTGETLWSWRPDEGVRFDQAPRKVHRGVAYWTDNMGRERIFVATPGFNLVALDAKTGQPAEGFGENGIVDMMRQLDDKSQDPIGKIGNSSPPVVVNDVVIIGPASIPGGRVNKANIKLDVMGFDARTGKKVWTFHTIPRKGEFGYDTWLKGSAEYTGNAGVWGPSSADPKLGLVYLNIEAATNDTYGGHRPGDNLFSSSIVAVDVKTGKRVWHQQLVRHDIWDYDLPPQPILIDLNVERAGGKIEQIPALVQLSKQAFAYVFDRRNGNPVWPIEQRPVRQTDVPGEWTAATQPIPTKPPAFDKQGVTVDDLIDFTPALRAEAIKAVANYRLGAMYDPPTLQVEGGHRGTIVAPGLGGGANWQGGAADPETGFVYVGSSTSPGLFAMVKNTNPEQTRVDADYTLGQGLPTVQGLRLLKPPYGRITAYNMNKGEIAWQIPNGDTPDNVKNNPALKGVNIPKTGKPSNAGILVTKTMLIAGEGSGGAPILHAYDKATGAEIWQTALPGPQVSLPMTYMINGRQFVVLAVRGSAANPQTGAPGFGAQLVAFALPQQGGGREGGRGGRGAGGGGGRGARGDGAGPQ